jgi:hypothetical protein
MKFTSILAVALLVMDTSAIRITQEGPISLSQESRMAKLKLKSRGEELKDQDEKIKTAEKMVDAAIDDASRREAIQAVGGLWAPYHPMIEAWHEVFYPKPPAWDPDHNPMDMVT